MAICGAKKRNGEACQKPPLKGKKKCRLHGGATTKAGAPTNNKNSAKHNIYSQFMAEDEIEFTQQAELDSIDSELKLCKVQLTRALKAKQKQELELLTAESNNAENTLQLIAIQMDDSEKGGTKTTFKYKDFDAVIDRFIGRIQSLTTQRNTLVLQELSIQKGKLELQQLIRDANPPKESQPSEDYKVTLRPDEDIPNEPIL